MIKFDNALSKKYEKQLENFNEDDMRKLEELKDLFEFLDDIIPLDDDEDDPPKNGRKRYSSLSTVFPGQAMPYTESCPPIPSILSLQALHECCHNDYDDKRYFRRSQPAPVSPRQV